MVLPKYYVILYFFLLSKARQANTEHMEMKFSQPIFVILVALTKNKVKKICNEPGITLNFGPDAQDQVEENQIYHN